MARLKMTLSRCKAQKPPCGLKFTVRCVRWCWMYSVTPPPAASSTIIPKCIVTIPDLDRPSPEPEQRRPVPKLGRKQPNQQRHRLELQMTKSHIERKHIPSPLQQLARVHGAIQNCAAGDARRKRSPAEQRGARSHNQSARQCCKS